MKLVDILARELTEWAGDVGAITQDKLTGELFDYYHCPLRGGNEREVSSIADDAGEAHDGASGAAVTRAEWQVAVDELNATKVVGLDGEMSDLMREEFEKVAAEKFCVDLKVIQDSRTSEGFDGFPYRVINQHGDQSENVNALLGVALLFWQASREYLVIELPIPVDFPDGTGDYHQMIDPDDLIDAIHAAGVKTK